MQEVDDEIVLLHMGTENYFSLDDVGTQMWNLIQKFEAIDDVVKALLDVYDVAEETLINDLDNFLTALGERNLVMISYE